MKLYQWLKLSFAKDYAVYWNHLSRLSNLLILMNISLFFLTELVTAHGYYFTFYSLLFLALIEIGMLLPFGLLKHLVYYCLHLLFLCIALYYLIASIIYWVNTSTI
ncbi:MAG: hypothetical protein EP298_09480 [Gammaproteobacteria bacterium]|nr:MAG: hypothetical protein EP298_09480 [Gammaproteobacteria bacterium]UTW42291.1 hypothetical protein KFE69_12505 [bacterium SCSIO 12844]